MEASSLLRSAKVFWGVVRDGVNGAREGGDGAGQGRAGQDG